MADEMISLDKEGEVFVLTMDYGENRWNTTFTRAFDKALAEVEASDGPAALVTVSTHQKFYSNGLDLEWMMAGRDEGDDHPGGDRNAFGPEAMAVFSRMMTLPVPTVAAVNGHAFGAGFMIALCHDIRIMREDRGYMCANEVELGMAIPEPELALFRHKMPINAFYETVQFAKRWTATDAHTAGFVQQACPLDELRERAIGTAAEHAHLAKHRDVYGWQKQHIWGENAALNNVHGPAYMLANGSDFPHGPNRMRD